MSGKNEVEAIDLGKVRDELIDGLDTHARADGSVITVKANGRTVAEVCVGARKLRLNLRSKPTKGMPKSIKLEGHSKSWAGGGINVDAANVKQARALLAAVVAAAPAAKQAEPTAADAVATSRKPEAERKATAARVKAVAGTARKRTGKRQPTAA